MSFSTANSVSMVRSLIKEATAKFWEDAEITLYLSGSMLSIWAKYAPWLYDTYKTWADFGTTASTSSYVISTAIGSNVFKISKILVKENGAKLRYIHSDEIYKYRSWEAGYPVGWTYKGKTSVELIPTPSATDADYLECYYMPTYTDITSFPDSLQMLVCVDAAILAKIKDEDPDEALMSMKQSYEQIAMQDLTMSSMDQVEVFPDFCEEDTLT